MKSSNARGMRRKKPCCCDSGACQMNDTADRPPMAVFLTNLAIGGLSAVSLIWQRLQSHRRHQGRLHLTISLCSALFSMPKSTFWTDNLFPSFGTDELSKPV